MSERPPGSGGEPDGLGSTDGVPTDGVPTDGEQTGGVPVERERRVVLRDVRRDRDMRRLVAIAAADGGVHIEGQDLGRGVAGAFGPGLIEYEWDWVVAPPDVAAAIAALGGAAGDDPLEVLRAWASANDGRDPGIALRDAGVTVRFWSRVGD